jgi:hypothetical protein
MQHYTLARGRGWMSPASAANAELSWIWEALQVEAQRQCAVFALIDLIQDPDLDSAEES